MYRQCKLPRVTTLLSYHLKYHPHYAKHCHHALSPSKISGGAHPQTRLAAMCSGLWLHPLILPVCMPPTFLLFPTPLLYMHRADTCAPIGAYFLSNSLPQPKANISPILAACTCPMHVAHANCTLLGWWATVREIVESHVKHVYSTTINTLYWGDI